MARDEVSTQNIDLEGTVLDFQEPPADGDVIESGRVALVVRASGGAVEATVQATASVDGLDVEDNVVTVSDGDTTMIGPFRKGTFGRDETSDFEGMVYVDYDDPTLVTRTVVTF